MINRLGRVSFLFLMVLMLVVVVDCSSEDDLPGDGSLGREEGESCSATHDCAPKLLCAGSGTCEQPGDPGTKGEGDSCDAKKDCLLELICSSQGKCTKPGNVAAGQPCAAAEQCATNLVCSALGKCAEKGDPGTKGKGDACEEPTACALGLVCLDSVCAQLAFWQGADCASEDSGPFRAYFEIPRGAKPLAEFYRLPFPNDIRLKDGNVDVSDHPNPATALPPPYDTVPAEYLDRLGKDVHGWAPNGTALLRLSGKIDLDTVKVGGDSPTLQMINIDKDSPTYGRTAGVEMFVSQGRDKYICQNYATVRPNTGAPLPPDTTIAAVFRKGIRNEDGELAVQDDDFKIVLAAKEPSDADEKAAWKAYEPLRAYIADKKIDPSTILSAAVFTTMRPRYRVGPLRQAVREEAAPAPDKVTLCDGAAKSPCDNGSDHVCPTKTSDKFDELQFVYKTPVFQKGKAPYTEIADGGNIVYEGDKPKVQREDDVCAALTVPKGEMPPNGWPVVIYAHGTGGSYRSFIDNGTAERLADVRDGSNELAKLAVISIDGGMHGPRRNSDEDPDLLFFNLRNPAAARDNTYQAVADKFQLVRVIEALDLAADSSPTKAAIKFDLSKIYYFGHSQGAITGTPFLAFEPQVNATVLSGAGGFLLGTMLYKTKPYNIAAGVQFVLADGKVGTNHPLLNLLQLYFEEVDPINYGRALFRAPEVGVSAKHTFVSWGVADSYTPTETIKALASTMGISQVDQKAERCGDGVCFGGEDCNSCSEDCTNKKNCGPFETGFKLVEPPVKENQATPDGSVTAAIAPYAGDGSYDDHFVVFEHDKGRKQSSHFLGSAARDVSPTIPK